MDITFYKFKWAKDENGQISDRGEHGYFISTGEPYNIVTMINMIRIRLNDPDAFITIENVTEISKAEYEDLTGKPFHVQ